MRIIFTNPDNTIGVIVPAPKFVAGLIEANEGLTEQQAMEAIAQKDVPTGSSYEIVADADIPADRTFRNAWEHDTTAAPEKVTVNIPKAQEIAHEVRRAARSKEFAPLDIKATIPAEATQAEADRQVVRDKYADMQIAIDNATTADEIKAAMPAGA